MGLASSGQDQAGRLPQQRYSGLVQPQFELQSWAAVLKGLPDKCVLAIVADLLFGLCGQEREIKAR